jgi:DNA-binding TFAR19-related protein (PDSD5 family)
MNLAEFPLCALAHRLPPEGIANAVEQLRARHMILGSVFPRFLGRATQHLLGMLQGGEQGAAAIRLALGDVQGQLADIVSSGLEDGLSGQQIVDMLGPLGSVLQEQANEALNRISSLDWTEGFTPAAGAEIASLLSSVLDPAAIQNLLNKALGADKTVSGLEKQLENLHAVAELDVTFTQEQVQGALDDIAADTTLTITEAVTTPEAAQAVLDIIQGVLADPTNELKALIDDQNLATQVMDAAEMGAKQTHLIFDSTVAFN